MSRPSRNSPEVRERAVRLVREHEAEHASQWAAIGEGHPELAAAAGEVRQVIMHGSSEPHLYLKFSGD